MLKRAFDFFLALFGLCLSSWLWLIIGLEILLESGLPIFYFQERVGKDGEVFKGIKFRSMIKGAERDVGPLQAKEDDARVTRLGRVLRATAMDELPQLWNILKGEMSFVGPRALRPIEIDTEDGLPKSVEEFAGFRERCLIRPGLTGIAQILAPRDISRQEKFRYDIWYLQHRNPWLDIRIILISFLITFRA